MIKQKRIRFLFIDLGDSMSVDDESKICDKVIAVNSFHLFLYILWYGKLNGIKNIIKDHLPRGKRYLVLESLFVYDARI